VVRRGRCPCLGRLVACGRAVRSLLPFVSSCLLHARRDSHCRTLCRPAARLSGESISKPLGVLLKSADQRRLRDLGTLSLRQLQALLRSAPAVQVRPTRPAYHTVAVLCVIHH